MRLSTGLHLSSEFKLQSLHVRLELRFLRLCAGLDLGVDIKLRTLRDGGSESLRSLTV
jgi:hypothetical protein